MEYRTLGRSGTVVSEFCLGAMTFGKATDDDTAQAQLELFVEHGGNFVDTANLYAAGRSEEIIGKWLAGRPGMRDRIVLATKGRYSLSDAPNGAGLSRVSLARALEGSLRRLGVEHIDLYQTHGWDDRTPIEETLRFLDDAVSAGRIRHVGVSNLAAWQLQKAALVAAFRGFTPVVSVQPQYNLLARDVERELVPVCEQERIGVLPWSPLGGGWLTGKYAPGAAAPAGSRLDDSDTPESFRRRGEAERTWRILDAVRAVAAERDTSQSRVALSWLLGRPAVTSVILGARTVAQLEHNLGAARLRLSAEDAQRLDEASAPEPSD